jgi:hypothetical protein
MNMLLLAIGVGLIGALAFRRAHRRCHGYGHLGGGFGHGPCGHGHGRRRWGRHGWGGRHGGPRRWLLDRALERIDASPAQERAIIAEVEQLEEKLHAAGRRMRDQRGSLADVVRGSELDEGGLAGIEHELEEAGSGARAAILEAVRKIHALLDDRQREQLAALLARGRDRGPGKPPAAGPFRS